MTQADEPLLSRHPPWIVQVVGRILYDIPALFGFALLLVIAILAIVAPLIGRYGPDVIDVSSINQLPSSSHWFGTDYLGRDMWARVLYGGRISLPAGFGVLAIAAGIGVPLGLIAGYFGKLPDGVIMRLMDVLLSFPGLLLALGVVAILGPDLTSAVIAIGIAFIPGFARVARASALAARERDYVDAARAQGAGHAHIIFRHILPNVLDPLIVLCTLGLGGAILATAGLSFLGVGTQLPTADWGTLLNEGLAHMFQSWSELTFPGLAVGLTVLGINLLGDGLSNALNPRV